MIFTPYNRRAAAGDSGTTYMSFLELKPMLSRRCFSMLLVFPPKVLVCIWMVGTCLLFSPHLLLFCSILYTFNLDVPAHPIISSFVDLCLTHLQCEKRLRRELNSAPYKTSNFLQKSSTWPSLTPLFPFRLNFQQGCWCQIGQQETGGFACC